MTTRFKSLVNCSFSDNSVFVCYNHRITCINAYRNLEILSLIIYDAESRLLTVYVRDLSL